MEDNSLCSTAKGFQKHYSKPRCSNYPTRSSLYPCNNWRHAVAAAAVTLSKDRRACSDGQQLNPLTVDCHQQSTDAIIHILASVPQNSIVFELFATPIYLAIYLLVPVQPLLQVGINEFHIQLRDVPQYMARARVVYWHCRQQSRDAIMNILAMLPQSSVVIELVTGAYLVYWH